MIECNEATVVAPSRAHVALIDLNGVTGRLYGGVGFMLSSPDNTVTARWADSGQSEVSGLSDLAGAAVGDALARAGLVAPELARVSIRVGSHVREHSGLGSKTAVVLASLCAARALSGAKVTDAQLVTASLRGGTSGVGVHGFFTGGWIFDAGQPRKDGSQFRPSNAAQPDHPSMLVGSEQAPESWRPYLLEFESLGASGRREESFFRSNSPVPAAEVLATLAAVYHGVRPSLRDGDIELLGASVAKINSVGFKAREVASQPAVVRDTLKSLTALRLGAVGLSSMGSTLFLVADAEDSSSVEAVLNDRQGPAGFSWRVGTFAAGGFKIG